MIGLQVGALRLVKLLGAGGMGEVYLAEHAVLKDLRAVKLLAPEFTQRPSIVARFVDEARAAAALKHRNLIRVHDIGQLPDQGRWFMVLDYLEGHTLARLIELHRGPVAPHLLTHILVQVMHCMAWVHDHRVVHRDLKPDNIFLTRRDSDASYPIVLDLGVAQLSEDFASGPGTRTGTVIGTPIYMAPEQLRGEKVTLAADLFALGVIAYEMATGGWFPYQAERTREEYLQLPPTELYHRQRTMAPIDPRHRAPMSDGLAELILSALAVDPARRPESARAFALRLADAVPGDGGHPDGREILRNVAPELVQGDAHYEAGRSSRGHLESPRAAGPPSTLTHAASQPFTPVPRPPAAPPRRGLIAGVAGAVLAATFGVAFVASSDSDRPAPPNRERADTPANVDASSTAAAPVTARPVSPRAEPALDPPERTQPVAPAPASPEPAPRAVESQASVADAPSAPAPPASPRVAPPPPPGTVASSGTPPAPATAPATSAPASSAPASSALPARRAPRATNTKPGELVVIVKPWGELWLDGKALGSTPWRGVVPAGPHRLKIVNGDLGKVETTTVTVSPEQTTTIRRQW